MAGEGGDAASDFTRCCFQKKETKSNATFLGFRYNWWCLPHPVYQRYLGSCKCSNGNPSNIPSQDFENPQPHKKMNSHKPTTRRCTLQNHQPCFSRQNISIRGHAVEKGRIHNVMNSWAHWGAFVNEFVFRFLPQEGPSALGRGASICHFVGDDRLVGDLAHSLFDLAHSLTAPNLGALECLPTPQPPNLNV